MPSSKKYSYEEEDIRRAVADVRQGKSVATAARERGVPRPTLIDKLMERRLSCHSVLTMDEEGILVNWIVISAKAGFPVTIPQVCASVQQLVKQLGCSQLLDRVLNQLLGVLNINISQY